jgi:RES domain
MPSRPGPHSPPPDDFAKRELLIRSIKERLFRIHRKQHGAIFYGCTGSNRFDDPQQRFGVLYAGLDEYAAFIEAHGQRTGANAVTESELRDRCLTAITPSRPLNAVDITGRGLAAMGADNRLAAADHDVARQWSRAVWEHPARVDGILFRSRHDPSRICVAIFDRGITWKKKTLGSLMENANAALLATLLDHYQFALI